ncbi:MAG: hypothetical protein KDK23_07100 [Leptospiraceae bacterium]|nr:hypothetical protein [Leptospiraceae bacterium]
MHCRSTFASLAVFVALATALPVYANSDEFEPARTGQQLARELLRTLNVVPPPLALSSGLNGDVPTTKEGYFTLSWPSYKTLRGKDTTDHIFLLLEGREPTMQRPTVFLDGPDHSIAMSGKLDGDLYYRVLLLQKELPSESDPEQIAQLSPATLGILQDYAGYSATEISPVYHVHVEHYSLLTAFGYFGAGAFIFLFTTIVIIIGTRRTREDT